MIGDVTTPRVLCDGGRRVGSKTANVTLTLPSASTTSREGGSGDRVSWKARFAQHGPTLCQGIFVCPCEFLHFWVLYCPSVHSHFYFTGNTGHLPHLLDTVESLTTKAAVRMSTALPFTLPSGRVLRFTDIYPPCAVLLTYKLTVFHQK